MTDYKNVPSDDDVVRMPDRAAWRAWLEENHATRTSVWLVLAKKNASIHLVDYESAVLEALCFGWIDSKVHAMDDESFRQYYAARKPAGTWTGLNKRRVAELERAGLMTDAGRAAIEVAKANGSWEFLDDIEALVLPPDLAEALDGHAGARETYDGFADSKKRAVLYWIKSAKRATTRTDRIAKTAEAASRGEAPLAWM
ncbi:MAG: YdeI/OmpD-associated family protein [Acidimicrobiia bacterium]|nr:YdeI/OmpD-associated family protein [Acidimicrobiia bacterium]MBT8193845.1 YdeI/OmpD-associated family protein [Acidimicrobiia bacterium]MBT8248057.1 YdeI/OmpD-associated family protein [Acidimicrobiia bacterium]NNF88639.1 hypothetical protein [Acidimicrobiia bacterium]NNL12927.1 hypothetical protein [Acidimicrobiia bacterium]